MNEAYYFFMSFQPVSVSGLTSILKIHFSKCTSVSACPAQNYREPYMCLLYKPTSPRPPLYCADFGLHNLPPRPHP